MRKRGKEEGVYDSPGKRTPGLFFCLSLSPTVQMTSDTLGLIWSNAWRTGGKVGLEIFSTYSEHMQTNSCDSPTKLSLACQRTYIFLTVQTLPCSIELKNTTFHVPSPSPFSSLTWNCVWKPERPVLESHLCRFSMACCISWMKI